MRAIVVALALASASLPAMGQALAPPSSHTGRAPAPGYTGFTTAPTAMPVPRIAAPADRAGPPGDTGGPVNGTPFSGMPSSAVHRNGSQISPALRDTSAGYNVMPSLSR